MRSGNEVWQSGLAKRCAGVSLGANHVWMLRYGAAEGSNRTLRIAPICPVRCAAGEVLELSSNIVFTAGFQLVIDGPQCSQEGSIAFVSKRILMP